MLGPDGKVVDERTVKAATKAREFVEKSIQELTNYTSKRPSVIRVNMKRFLVLTEVGWIDRWPGITIKAA